ncbi:hypothetical protein [Photobacterium leiognathi]|uniref:hypothetical protein n=1 Tax=Photobacterium leiognathi TaxID=553611 RepID=UPI002981F500|nr:hypothetical protein [Photobacterium leiognathi]
MYNRSRKKVSGTAYRQNLDAQDVAKYSYLLAEINRAYFKEKHDMPIEVTAKVLPDGMRETTITITLVEKNEYHVKLDNELHRRCGLPVYGR